LRVVTDNGAFSIGARKSETVLLTLLARFNQVVSVGQLVDEIWGVSAPRRANAALHVHVSQLRKLLRRGKSTESPIVTRSPGYVLDLGPDELDLLDFQKLLRSGKTHQRAGEHEEAVDDLKAALDLWRGPALGAPVTGPIISGFSAWLAENRLECIDALVESTLALGNYSDVIGFLYTMIAEQPLHEMFYHQLMIALHRSGRRADALRVYQTARGVLRGELGLEPCQSLRNLHAAILVESEVGPLVH
jgi:DNA-binding SARP family transcriptional activator